MSLFEAILLGIIQGLTEFLPVSSSGHIELGKELLDVQIKDPLLFSIVVHAATALSTIVIYFRDILNLLKGLFQFKWNTETKFVAMIAVSMLPVAVIGLLFEKQIETFFDGEILLVGCMLLVTAVLLWFSSKTKAQDGAVGFLQAMIIGVAQSIAILPGISRSGATISTALLLGIKREEAARFSFLMVLPPILGATALKLKDYLEASYGHPAAGESVATLQEVTPLALGLGFVAAFVAGLFACRWMIALVKRAKLEYFAIYCAIVGVIAIIYGLLS